jgi:hypothetical protein
MSEIKVIGSRTDTAEMCGIACGPIGFDVACTEMHIQEDGIDKYLTMCWCSEASELLETNSTSEPIYDILLDEDPSDEDLEKLDSLREAGQGFDECDPDSPYHELFVKMAGNLLDAMKKAEMFDEENVDAWGDWEWLKALLGFKLPNYEDES